MGIKITPITILIIVSVGMMITSLGVIYEQDKALWEGESFKFLSGEGEELDGTYYNGSISAGVIILEGFGSDQVAQKGIVSEFVELGFHVFTFDFSGHGRSTGAIGLDNAETDILAREVLVAKDEFMQKSQLEPSQIVMVGHSMGARVSVQAATMDPEPVNSLILFGVQINVQTNVQSDFFTGVSDIDLQWVQNLSKNNPKLDILLISGSWDDIITPDSVRALHSQMQSITDTTTNQNFSREYHLIPRVVHNYEIYSPRALELAKTFAIEQLQISSEQNPAATNMQIRLICWGVFLFSIFVFLICLARSIKPPELEENQEPDIVITDYRKYFISKLKSWIVALPIFVLIASLLLFIPLGQPLFNLVYVGFLGSYGILLIFKYQKGKVKGIEGSVTLKTITRSNHGHVNHPILGYLLASMILALIIIFARSGWFYLFPPNYRIVWLVIYTVLSAIGFLVGNYEGQQIKLQPKHPKTTSFNNTMIGILPFYLLVLLYIVINSISGMLGAIQGLVILGIAILSGKTILKYSQNPIFTALFQALMLQLSVLPQGVLFTPFF